MQKFVRKKKTLFKDDTLNFLKMKKKSALQRAQ